MRANVYVICRRHCCWVGTFAAPPRLLVQPHPPAITCWTLQAERDHRLLSASSPESPEDAPTASA